MVGAGRAMPDGQSRFDGQWSENHCMVFSRRRTWISAPASIAASFFVSPSARQLTVESDKRSAAP